MAGSERLRPEPAAHPPLRWRQPTGARPATGPDPARTVDSTAWWTAAQAASGPDRRFPLPGPVQRAAGRTPVQRQADPGTGQSRYLESLTGQADVDPTTLDQAEFDRGQREGLRTALGPFGTTLLFNVIIGAALGGLLAYAAPVYVLAAVAIGLTALIGTVIGSIRDRITEFTADTGRMPTDAELVEQVALGMIDPTGVVLMYEGWRARRLSGGRLTSEQAGHRYGYGLGLLLTALASLGAGLLSNRLTVPVVRRIDARLALGNRPTVPAPPPANPRSRATTSGTDERRSTPKAAPKPLREPPSAPSHPAVSVAAGGPLWQLALRMGGSSKGTVRSALPELKLDPDDFLRRRGNSWMMLGEAVENRVLTARSLGGDDRMFAFTPEATAALESALRDGPAEFTVRQADDLLKIGRQASADLLHALAEAKVLQEVAGRRNPTYRFDALPGTRIVPIDD